MLVDEQLLTREDGRWVASSDLAELPVPSTIQALLAARLEGLPADERAILTARGGRGRGVSPGRRQRARPPALDRRSSPALALVRRDLIRPTAPTSPARRPTASVTS